MLLREKLKASTAAAHRALEARLMLTDPQLSFERYVWYLQCLLPFYRSLCERFDAPAFRTPLAADCASRVAWLEDDLKYLEMHCTYGNAPEEFLPCVTASPELIGVSYVVEGAALGGRALYVRLHARWGIAQHGGASFLFGFGAETARRWQAFVAALNGLLLDQQDQNRCIAAACQTFTGLTQWLAHNERNASPYRSLARISV